MVSKPLVSVLINNYNKEKYCNRAVRSIINQTYKNIEIIFFDDGSSDNSVKNIKRSFRKNLKKVNIIENKLRGKIFSFNQINAINVSIKKSKGEIICILDSDDFYKKDKIENVVKFFNKNRDKHIVLDLPINYFNKNKQINSKENYFLRSDKWSKFPPTSCISLKKNKISNVLKKISIKKFNELWFDFRIITYFSYLKNEFQILPKHLTYYSQDSDNFDKRYKKFSNQIWWKRRYQAFKFLEYLNKKKYNKDKTNFDYLLTNLINNFLKLN